MADVHFVTNFFNNDQTISANCINYRTLKYSVVQTSFKFLNIVVVEKNYINIFFESLKILQKFYTNITCKAYLVHNYHISGSTLDLYQILAMHQGYNVDDCWKGLLVIFESSTLLNCSSLIDYMKAYARGKPSHIAVQERFDLHLSLQMQMFITNYTIPFKEHSSLAVNGINHLICELDVINFDELFSPIGFYKLDETNGQLIYLPSIENTDFLQQLPLFVIDIETIANNMEVVPLGITPDEKISSLVLLVQYFEVSVYYIFYYVPEPFSHLAQDFNKQFEERYTNEEANIMVHVKSFSSDKQLVESFLHLYSKGTILKNITGNSNYPHIFTGHNIFQYDLPVIANIMKRYKMHLLFDNYVEIENVHSPPALFRFHPTAIMIDLFQVAKRNMLSSVGYSLKAMAKSVQAKSNVEKYDLSSVNIRHFYILADSALRKNEQHEPELNAKANKQKRIAILSQYFEMQPNLEQYIQINKNHEMNLNDLQIDSIPINQEADFQHVDNAAIRVLDRLEKILIYNMTDCSVVSNILKANNYYNLLVQFAKIFNLPVESACYMGNSFRLRSCIQSMQLRFNHFFGVTDRNNYILELKSSGNFHKGISLNDTTGCTTDLINWNNTTSSKKAFTGALNFARIGVEINAFGIDFTSYYPNLLCARQMSMHKISQITTKQLLNLAQLQFVEEAVRTNVFTLYCAEDLYATQSIALSYRGREIAHRLSMDDLYAYHEETDGEGKLILYMEESQPDALYRITESLLSLRAESKKKLKDTKSNLDNANKQLAKLIQNNPPNELPASALMTIPADNNELEQLSDNEKERHSELINTMAVIDRLHKLRNVQDATQLCQKIVVNSLYGVLGLKEFSYSHVPIAALITLLGRAKLALCCRLATYFYYREILTNAIYSDLHETIPSNTSSSGSSGSVLAVRNMSGKLVTMEYLDQVYLYLCEIAPFRRTADESHQSYFIGEPLMHDDVFMNTDIVVYIDTDGIVLTNFLNINCLPVLDNVNKFMEQYLPSKCLVLEADKKYEIIGILAKKTYFLVNNKSELLSLNIPDVQKYFQAIQTTHNGYERNAANYIKNIYNYITALVYISKKFNIEINPVEVFFDIFSYMMHLNQCLLYVNVPLNEHQDKSTDLAQYIEKNTSNYQGSIVTYMVLYLKDLMKNVYYTQIEWEAKQITIHFVKTLRNHVKVMWRILSMCNTSPFISQYLQENNAAIISKMQLYATAIYTKWRNKSEIETEEMTQIENVFHTRQFKLESRLSCQNNVTAENISLKERNSTFVRFSYDFANRKLPNFICEQIVIGLSDYNMDDDNDE